VSEGPPPTFVSRLPRTIGLLALFGLLVIVAINTLRTPGQSSSGPPAGRALPAFAAPLASSPLEGDVNVATRARQGAAGARPACELRGPGVLTSCELAEDGPAALAFFVTGRERCVDQVDELAQAARSVPGMRVAAVALGGERTEVRRLVAERGWRFPVAHDRDAILANLYGVAVCPQVTYATRGGRVQGSSVGELDGGELVRRLRALASDG
jgi:hypothetical protein